MKKIFLNHMKGFMITTIIINLLFIITIVGPVDNLLFFLFGMIMFIILEIDIYILITIMINHKINKNGMKLLNTCNPDPYIESLKKDISKINKNKNISAYESRSFDLYQAELFKYGRTDSLLNKLETININNFNLNSTKTTYKIQLAILYIDKKEYDKADILINSLDKEKNKEDIELLNEIKILLSDEEKDQEEYFLNRYSYEKEVYLINKITYIRDLSTYYLKTHKYNNAKLCLNYMIEYGANLNCAIKAKKQLEEIKNKKSNDEINPKLNHLLFETKPITKNKKAIILTTITIIILMLILFLLWIISDKTLLAITGEEFKGYMNKNVCKVHYKNEFNDIKKVNYAYITDKKCKYDIGFIEYDEESNKETPDEIAEYLQYKYNLSEPTIDRTLPNDPYNKIIYNGIYYAKIYRKDNTLIYIVSNKKDKEKANNILKSLRYDDKYPFRSLFN